MFSNYCELVITISFTEDVPMSYMQSTLTGIINRIMLLNERLKELHKQNTYKPICYCLPYPIPQDKIYHKNSLYCFNIRTPHSSFACALKSCLAKTSGIAKVISIEIRNYPRVHIAEMTSLTPVICTVNKRCWVSENGIGLLADRLNINMFKKCKAMDPDFTEPADLFFDGIQLLNKKPIIVNYKGTTLLGHKVRLSIKTDEWAQKMAFNALSVGAGEKNALGFGYMVMK